MKEIREGINKIQKRLSIIGKRTEEEKNRIIRKEKEVKALCRICDVEIAGCINQLLTGFEKRINKHKHISSSVSEELIEKLCKSSKELMVHMYDHGFREDQWVKQLDTDRMVKYLQKTLGYKLLSLFCIFPSQRILESALYRLAMNSLEYEIMISIGGEK